MTRIWELRDRQLRPFKGGYSAYLMQREAADARQRKDADTTTEQIARERELIQRYRSHRKYPKMHEHEQSPGGAARREDGSAPAQAAAGAADPGAARRRPGALRGRGAHPGADAHRLPAQRGGAPGHAHPARGAARGDPRRPYRRRRAERRRQDHAAAHRRGRPAAARGVRAPGRQRPAGLPRPDPGRAHPGRDGLDAILAAGRVENGPARSYLARFLFRGEDVFKPVAELSGGERSRLELALLGITPANLLLLDEPTNHLDIPAREALESFLRESRATMLIVSHDRRLLESVCERPVGGRAGRGRRAAARSRRSMAAIGMATGGRRGLDGRG